MWSHRMLVIWTFSALEIKKNRLCHVPQPCADFGKCCRMSGLKSIVLLSSKCIQVGVTGVNLLSRIWAFIIEISETSITNRFREIKVWNRHHYLNHPSVSDTDFFERTVPTLNETLLRSNIPGCDTLRDLEIPLPLRSKFRLYPTSRNISDPHENNIFEWKDSEEYFNRLEETFPRVDYQFLDPLWRLDRLQKVKKLVKMAISLGFSEKELEKGMQNGCVMDFNMENRIIDL